MSVAEKDKERNKEKKETTNWCIEVILHALLWYSC